MNTTNKKRQVERHMFAGSVKTFSLAGLGLCVTLALASPLAQASLPGGDVGKVTLVLGKAWITKPGASRVAVKVGTDVGVHDKIDTASDGHVHVRFIDTALVSVRPQSSLEIERYDYDAADPASSKVKLNLLEGETRAISGEAAQKARQNFRMNTPVAAIGVRGTDFVANADGGEVEARINEGTIIVTPFSNECLADALGPCGTNSLELAYNYGANQIVQVGNAGNAVLLPISASGLPESVVGEPLVQPPQPQVASASASASEKKRDSDELYAESVVSLAVNPRLVRPGSSGPQGPIGEPAIPQLPEFTPDVALSTQALKENQLIWGRRYENGLAYERMTVDEATALAGRKPGPGNDYYAVYREPTLPRLAPDLGVASFALNSAQSLYHSNGAIELLDVNGGLLNIDFSRSTFTTSLTMRGATLGTIDFSASGFVLDGGFLNSVSATQEMAGAVSFDGDEAAYFFEKTLENGTIDGLTHWGIRP